MLRMPVMPADIGRWVLDGILPFLDLQVRERA